MSNLPTLQLVPENDINESELEDPNPGWLIEDIGGLMAHPPAARLHQQKDSSTFSMGGGRRNKAGHIKMKSKGARVNGKTDVNGMKRMLTYKNYSEIAGATRTKEIRALRLFDTFDLDKHQNLPLATGTIDQGDLHDKDNTSEDGVEPPLTSEFIFRKIRERKEAERKRRDRTFTVAFGSVLGRKNESMASSTINEEIVPQPPTQQKPSHGNGRNGRTTESSTENARNKEIEPEVMITPPAYPMLEVTLSDPEVSDPTALLAEQIAMERSAILGKILAFVKASLYSHTVDHIALLMKEHRHKSRMIIHSRVMKYVEVKRVKRVVNTCFGVLRFLLALRIHKKRRALRLITRFANDYNVNHTHNIVRRFLGKVRRCQRYVRDFLCINKARRNFVARYWLKIEKHIRLLHEKEEKIAIALKKKEIADQIAKSRRKNKKMAGMDSRWDHIHTKVCNLLLQADMVQLQYANAKNGLFQMQSYGNKVKWGALSAPSTSRKEKSKDDESNPTSRSLPTAPGPSKFKGPMAEMMKNLREAAYMQELESFPPNPKDGLDYIDEAERESIISTLVTARRKAHLVKLKEMREAALSNAQMTDNEAKVLLQTITQPHNIASKTLSDLVAQQLSGSLTPEEWKAYSWQKRHLLIIHGHSTLKSWRVTIEEIVRKDILEKKRKREAREKNESAMGEGVMPGVGEGEEKGIKDERKEDIEFTEPSQLLDECDSLYSSYTQS